MAHNLPQHPLHGDGLRTGRRNRTLVLAPLVCLLCLLCLAWSQGWAGAAEGPEQSACLSHTFGPKDRVLDLGIQPLWVPTSTITEAMRRDNVLRREMAKLGLTVRFHPYWLGSEGNRCLLSGQLDGLLAGDMPTITAASQGRVVVMTLVHQGFASIISKSSRRMADLRGKTIGYPAGSSAHFVLLRSLELHGVKTDQVTLVPYPSVKQAFEKFQAGDFEAIVTWEPQTTMLAKLVPEARILQRSIFDGYMYFNASAVERHPQGVRQIIAAQLRAMAWMRQSDDNLHQACQWAIDEQISFGGQPAPIGVAEYAALVKNSLLDVATLPEVPVAHTAPDGKVFAQHQFLVRLGTLPKDSAFQRIKDSFDNCMISEVRNQPEVYGLAQFDYAKEAQ